MRNFVGLELHPSLRHESAGVPGAVLRRSSSMSTAEDAMLQECLQLAQEVREVEAAHAPWQRDVAVKTEAVARLRPQHTTKSRSLSCCTSDVRALAALPAVHVPMARVPCG